MSANTLYWAACLGHIHTLCVMFMVVSGGVLFLFLAGYCISKETPPKTFFISCVVVFVLSILGSVFVPTTDEYIEILKVTKEVKK